MTVSGPTQKTIRRLFALSRNRCAFPKCQTALIQDQTIVGEICHIKAASPGGPRYDPQQTDEARHDSDNLILLCRIHHTVIDDDDVSYTAQRIADMKKAHEALATTISEDESARSAVLLLSVNQSGGIVAHSVHAHTINVHQGSPEIAGKGDSVRDYFTPELARILAQQIYSLGRILANFIMTSTGQTPPGDTWVSLRPWQPVLYPTAMEFRELSAADATLLIEFYDSLREITDTIDDWADTHPLTDFNAWNVLMQKVQNNIKIGQKAVQRYCPDRPYSPLIPAGGTLLERSAREVSLADRALEAHLERWRTSQMKKPEIAPIARGVPRTPPRRH